MDGTTAIKIDYYEELKAKVDKYDEKETPYKAEPLMEEENGRRDAVCRCSGVVKEGEFYCWNCGQKLEWSV